MKKEFRRLSARMLMVLVLAGVALAPQPAYARIPPQCLGDCFECVLTCLSMCGGYCSQTYCWGDENSCSCWWRC